MRSSPVYVLSLIAVLITASSAHADNVQVSSVEFVGANNIETTVGTAVDVAFRVIATASSCDAADGSALELALPAVAGLSVSPSSLTFTSCGPSAWQTLTLTATAAVANTSIVPTLTDSVGSYNNQAAFTFLALSTNTPPTLVLPLSITAEATSPAGAVVAFTATFDDAEDGTGAADCSPASGSVFALGTTPVACGYTDTGGLSVNGDFSVTVEDTTAPLIAFVSATPPANGASWNNEPVVLRWSCADLVGVVSAIVQETLAGPGANLGATGECEDLAGNSATDFQGGYNIDLEVPSGTATLVGCALGTNDWCKGPTAPHWEFACSDDLSGFVDCPASPGADLAQGEHAAGSIAIHDAADNGGSIGLDPVKVDTVDPTIVAGGALAAPAFYYGVLSATPPTCTADDATSGPKSCVVTGYSLAVGAHTLVSTATDNAGNVLVQEFDYTILAWTLGGFFAPVDGTNDATIYNTVKAGSTVPLKFEVFAASEITDVAAIKSLTTTKVVCTNGADEAAVETVATGGTSLRYDATAGQFVYNWKTPTVKGCYRTTLETQDGSKIWAMFKTK